MAFLLLLILGLLLFAFRQDWREERQENIRALRQIGEAVRDLDTDFRESGILRMTRKHTSESKE